MPNLVNRMVVRELSETLGKAEGLLIVSMSGLSVRETEALRNSLAEHGVRLRMIRNRLARIAFVESGLELPGEMLAGNIACVCGGLDDAIHAAKVLHKSDARKAGKVALKGGLLEGNLLGAQEAVALAGLPGRDELLAQLVGSIIGPARMLVCLLNAPASALVRVLQARVDADDGPEEAA